MCASRWRTVEAVGTGGLVEVDHSLFRGDERRERGDGLRHRGQANGKCSIAVRRGASVLIDDTWRAKSTGQPSIWRSACTRGDTSRGMERRNISGTGAYEPIVGYSRAVVVGDRVHVSGTAANPADGSPPPEDIYDQTRVCSSSSAPLWSRPGAASRTSCAHASTS